MAKKPPSPQSARYRRTRAAHRDETAEDYVEAVARLVRERGSARVGELAAHMGVSHVTVSKTISRIARAGLVSSLPYRGVTLTPEGLRMARRSAQRHQTVLDFLRALGVPEAQAQIDAEGIEHHVSSATIAAMRRMARSHGNR